MQGSGPVFPSTSSITRESGRSKHSESFPESQWEIPLRNGLIGGIGAIFCLSYGYERNLLACINRTALKTKCTTYYISSSTWCILNVISLHVGHILQYVERSPPFYRLEEFFAGAVVVVVGVVVAGVVVAGVRGEIVARSGVLVAAGLPAVVAASVA